MWVTSWTGSLLVSADSWQERACVVICIFILMVERMSGTVLYPLVSDRGSVAVRTCQRADVFTGVVFADSLLLCDVAHRYVETQTVFVRRLKQTTTNLIRAEVTQSTENLWILIPPSTVWRFVAFACFTSLTKSFYLFLTIQRFTSSAVWLWLDLWPLLITTVY